MRQIANKHFLIRIYYYDRKKSQIVRYKGLVDCIGLARAKMAIRDAYASRADKYTLKTRKGFKIDFYII